MNESFPLHVGFILDGNRRWAKAKGLTKTLGHMRGVNRAKKIVKHAAKLGIQIVSLYAFSKENWNRPKEEVGYLMKLFNDFLEKNVRELHKEDIRLRFLGDISGLPDFLQKNIKNALELTKENKRMTVQLALNYTGRDEIVRAVKKVVSQKLPINEENINNFLDTGGAHDPDLIIRTSGEQRLSGFLLWESAYSELYFTKIAWPDFTDSEFEKAIEDYKNRQRRFGA